MKVSLEHRVNPKMLALAIILKALAAANLSWLDNYDAATAKEVLEIYSAYINNIFAQIEHLKKDEVIAIVDEEKQDDTDSESIEDAY